MNTSRLEPGLLKVFRGFVGLRLALLVLTFCSNTRNTPRVQRYPLLGILETSFLLVYLARPWPRKVLGRLYLPLALIVASAGPILEHALTVLLRIGHGASRIQAATDNWMVIVVLFVPLVLASWQYGFKSVLIFCVDTSLLELVLAVPLAILGGPRWITMFGLTFGSAVLYLVVGYLVARLVAAQRVQREELARANAQLTHYATTIERLTISHERNRLARELHDTLAHTLSAVAVQLEAAEALWDYDPAATRQAMNKAQQLTRDGLQETRRALQAMRAKPLEDLGLALAVRQLAEQGAERAGLALKTQIDPKLGTLRPEVEQSVYRVAEEAVANVVRHANAKKLAVTLGRENHAITLAVIDDGQGFDLSARRQNGHYGLTGMQERAALCGGVINVSSQPGKGTAVRLVIQDK